jgi:hypothetical protein
MPPLIHANEHAAPHACPETGTKSRSDSARVEDLLRKLHAVMPADLADRLHAGAAPARTDETPRFVTGIAPLDALLGGGLPRGRLCEISGPLSSGRTSLVIALLAAVTRSGEIAALVDAADAFDPASAATAGVALESVLWARAPKPREALRCAERLLDARGFGIVVVDVGDATDRVQRPATVLTADRHRTSPTNPSLWKRLAHSAHASGTALLVSASHAQAGPFAALTLEARAVRAHFADRPVWLEGLEARVVPVRSRIGARADAADLRWSLRAG